MKPQCQYKHPPRRRCSPNVKLSQVPAAPKDVYAGGDPHAMLGNAIRHLEYCFQIINGLAQNGEIGGTSTLKPMHEALKLVRGAREGLNVPAGRQYPNPEDWGKLD